MSLSHNVEPSTEKQRASREGGQKHWKEYETGYSKLAAFMAHDPDKSTTIFRKFDRLSAYNLLLMESEIATIEEELDRLEDEVRNKKRESQTALSSTEREQRMGDLQALGQSWEYLQMARRGANRELAELAERRLQLAWELRAKLKEYHEALKLAGDIMNFSEPNRRTLKGTRALFNGNPVTGAGTMLLGAGVEKRLRDKNDLCVLRAPPEPDRLTSLFEGRLASLFREKKDGIVLHKTVDITVSVLSTVAAALLLIGAVLTLFFVTNPGARLGILGGFTVFFALSLALFTNARRQDVFAATAAYAAVLVVFVSGNLASTNSTSSSSSTGQAVSLPTSTIFATVSRIVSLTVTATTTSAANSSGTPTSTPASAGKKSYTGIIAGSVVGGVAFIVMVLFLCYFCLRRRAYKSGKAESAYNPPEAYRGPTSTFASAPEISAPFPHPYSPASSPPPQSNKSHVFGPLGVREDDPYQQGFKPPAEYVAPTSFTARQRNVSEMTA